MPLQEKQELLEKQGSIMQALYIYIYIYIYVYMYIWYM